MPKATERATPQWMLIVAEQVAIQYNRSAPPSTRIVTTGTKHWSSRGRFVSSNGDDGTIEEYIALTLGSDPIDQAVVLIHELAHWLAPRTEHHGSRFWNIYYDLVNEYELPCFYAICRAACYKTTAFWTATERYKLSWEQKVYLRLLMTGDEVLKRPTGRITNWSPTFPWGKLLSLPA